MLAQERRFTRSISRFLKRKIGNLLVEAPEAAVVDCFRRLAFVDAVATFTPRMKLDRLSQDAYWTRIPKTDVRVGQALSYVTHRLFASEADVRISNDFVRRELDEAIEKAKELE